MTISSIAEDTLRIYIASSTTWKEILQKCGYNNCGCSKYLKKRIQELNIDVAHIKTKTSISNDFVKYKLADILVSNSNYASMVRLKLRLIKELKWEEKCSVCNLTKWMDKPIPLEIDHINGIHTDNTITNIRFICPNCHAQTDTYKGKNKKTYIERGKVLTHSNCIDCNCNISINTLRCVKCNAFHNRRAIRPSYDEIIEYRKHLSLEEIGKKFNVARTTIQRWIKYYEDLDKNK
jgi:hypothetical protein